MTLGSFEAGRDERDRSGDRAVVAARELTKEVGSGAQRVVAVRGVDLAVRRGELVAIVGPSGSGKSTLLAVLGALSSPTQGQVTIDGIDPGTLSEGDRSRFRAQRIGFVFQSPALIPYLTVTENIALAALVAGIERAEARHRAERLQAELDLDHRADFLPTALSGGELQRVGLGRALVTDPILLLADEPTANLDVARGQAVIRLIAEQVRGRDRAGLLVTHDEHAAQAADRVLHLVDGRIERDH